MCGASLSEWCNHLFRDVPTTKHMLRAAKHLLRSPAQDYFRRFARCRPISHDADISPLPLIMPHLRNWKDFGTYDAVVVDKTLETAALVQPGHMNLLTRPRKTGKSLALSAAKAILAAKTELFEGTKLMAAVENGDPTVAHVARLWEKGAGVPVLHLDFSFVSADPEVFEENLLAYIRAVSSDFDIQLTRPDIRGALRELFQKEEKQGQRLAVLLDEYDLPITKMLRHTGGEMNEYLDANIRVLREFFMSLTSAVALNGHCLFMTGVSRFSHATLFEGTPTTDQSFASEHQRAFHFSWEEIVETYPRHLEVLLDVREEETMEELRQTMEACYGGYSFSPHALDRDSRLFNPYDMICLLAEPEKCPRSGQLPEFWCAQGRSGWLDRHIDAGFIRHGRWSSQQSLDLDSSLASVDFTELGKDPEITASLLQQTGFLTCGKHYEGGERGKVTLVPPNALAQKVLQGILLNPVVPREAGFDKGLECVRDLFAAGDLFGVWQQLGCVLDVGENHHIGNVDKTVVKWLVSALVHLVEASGEILFFREPEIAGRSDFIFCYGPRNRQGQWKYGVVVEAKLMQPAAGRKVEEEGSATQTKDVTSGDCGRESSIFIDKQLADNVGGEERVRKQVRAAFERIRRENYDMDVPARYEHLRHAVVVWDCKAQVVAYSERSVDRKNH